MIEQDSDRGLQRPMVTMIEHDLDRGLQSRMVAKIEQKPGGEFRPSKEVATTAQCAKVRQDGSIDFDAYRADAARERREMRDRLVWEVALPFLLGAPARLVARAFAALTGGRNVAGPVAGASKAVRQRSRSSGLRASRPIRSRSRSLDGKSLGASAEAQGQTGVAARAGGAA